MSDDKRYTSLSANTIMAKLTNHVQRTRLKTSSTDKQYSLVPEDNFRSGFRNVSHQQQFFSELPRHPDDQTIRTNYEIVLINSADRGKLVEKRMRVKT